MAKKIQTSRTSLSKSRSFARKTNTRKPLPRYLIVCGGEKTEKHYFEAFPVSSKVVIDVVGLKRSPSHVVERAIKEKRKDPDIDQVWCVFDLDHFVKDFTEAVEKARSVKKEEGIEIEIAYSNEAFELWYLLHFDYCDSKISRDQYVDKLTKKLAKLTGYEYKKNSLDMYSILLLKQQDAIKNAKKLLETHSHHLSPVNKKPSTTVHLLVQELNQYLSK